MAAKKKIAKKKTVKKVAKKKAVKKTAKKATKKTTKKSVKKVVKKTASKGGSKVTLGGNPVSTSGKLPKEGCCCSIVHSYHRNTARNFEQGLAWQACYLEHFPKHRHTNMRNQHAYV